MLSREEILALPAGKWMDSAIAEHVLGHVWLHNKRYGLLRSSEDADDIVEDGNARYGKHPAHDDGSWIGPDEKYSTDIADAWLIVEALAETHDLDLRTRYRRVEGGGPMQKKGVWGQFNPKGVLRGFCNPIAEDAPLAICRAALLTLLESAAPSTSKEEGQPG